jgi:3-oxocholest-4-en-26-oyl-CoA dehydrogenase alpha subunit
MFLDETAEQRALRKELREYFASLLTPKIRAELGAAGEGSPVFRELVKKMGSDGWLGIGWPVQYGGQGRDATDQFIFFDEVQRAAAPFPFVTINTVGPTLINFGSEAQKQEYLPKILQGEINFAIGYTEPSAGTDLASLRTKAVLSSSANGDEWVINGNKIYTSGANQADYIWLACRTDADVAKHKGISIIIVPTDSPGFSWTPIVTVGDIVTTTTFYDDVRVPAENVVSGVNAGWQLITTQLNHERVGLAALAGLTYRLFDDVLDYCRVTDSGNGKPMIEVSWVQRNLAHAHALCQAMKLLNWRLTAAVAADTLSGADASASKIFGVETQVEVYRLLLEILGFGGYINAGSSGAALHGELEHAARAAQINTFGGGVVEVLREIVATSGLGMARAPR